jgi:hypothetical protein
MNFEENKEELFAEMQNDAYTETFNLLKTKVELALAGRYQNSMQINLTMDLRGNEGEGQRLALQGGITFQPSESVMRKFGVPQWTWKSLHRVHQTSEIWTTFQGGRADVVDRMTDELCDELVAQHDIFETSAHDINFPAIVRNNSVRRVRKR